jgi:hypothetical protein
MNAKKDTVKIEVGKFYLYGPPQWGPEAIIRIDGVNASGHFWARWLGLGPNIQDTFFNFKSFIPGKNSYFLRELTPAEVEKAVTLVINKLRRFALGEDSANTDLGFRNEANEFIGNVVRAVRPRLVPGRAFFAPCIDRPEE